MGGTDAARSPVCSRTPLPTTGKASLLVAGFRLLHSFVLIFQFTPFQCASRAFDRREEHLGPMNVPVFRYGVYPPAALVAIETLIARARRYSEGVSDDIDFALQFMQHRSGAGGRVQPGASASRRSFWVQFSGFRMWCVPLLSDQRPAAQRSPIIAPPSSEAS